MNAPILLDGAMGTELIARGLAPGASPDLWNLQRPSSVRAVHEAYAASGAQVLTTNSFGANPVRLASCGARDVTTELNRAAVRLAREAAPDLMVAGDIGPTGEMLAPLGRLSADEASRAFGEQAKALASAGVDLFILETFFSAQEAVHALKAVRAACSLPVWVTLTFRQTPRGFFTVYGDPLLASCLRLLEEGAERVGANCTLSPAAMVSLAELVVPELGGATVFQPNAGEPEVRDDGLFYPTTPEEFSRELARIAALGAGAVGGCCGTTPAHIEACARTIERRVT